MITFNQYKQKKKKAQKFILRLPAAFAICYIICLPVWVYWFINHEHIESRFDSEMPKNMSYATYAFKNGDIIWSRYDDANKVNDSILLHREYEAKEAFRKYNYIHSL